VASYSAVIDLRVQGEDRLRAVNDKLEVIEGLTKRIKPVPTLFDKRGTEELIRAKQELSALVKQYADGNTRVAKFSTSIAGLGQQLSGFRTVAANARVNTDEFNNALKAAEITSGRLLSAELKRLTSLQNIYTRQPAGGLTAEEQGPSKMVRDLLAVRKEVPNSITALRTYAQQLDYVFQLVEGGSQEYRQLQKAIADVNKQMNMLQGRGPVQGPAAPPRAPRTGGPLAQTAFFNPNPGFENLALGAGFPLLFGGGPGQVAGGLLGSFFGTGFGGQILGSAIGQQLEDAVKRIRDIGTALRTLNMDTLRDSVIFVNAQLETQVRLLQEAGRFDEARAAIANEISKQTGLQPELISSTTSEVNRLVNIWNNFLGAVSGTLSILGAPFIRAMQSILQFASLAFQGFNKIASVLGQWLSTTDYISQATSDLTEEQLKAQAAAEAEIDASIRKLRVTKELLEIEKQRIEGSNRIAQVSQATAERDKALLENRAALEEKIREINKNTNGVSEDTLRLQRGIAEAESHQKDQLLQINYQKNIQKIRNAEILAQLRDQADAEAARNSLLALTSNTETQRLGIEQQRLQQQLQFVTSLNQESGLINQIAASRIAQADQEYQTQLLSLDAAVQRATAELQIVQARFQQNNANIEDVNAAQRKLELALATRDAESGTAVLKRQQAIETAEIERRQALVNAYAAENERINARIALRLQEQSAALDNQARYWSAINQATQTINNLEIQSLERELERTNSVSRRRDIIERINQLEVENAKVTLLATRAQIRAEVQRSALAYRRAQQEFAALRAAIAYARSIGIINREQNEALEAQASALRIAFDNLRVTELIADAQSKAADSVYKAAVNAANLKSQMLSTQTAANGVASALDRASVGAASLSAATGGSARTREQARALSAANPGGGPVYFTTPDGRRGNVRTFVISNGPRPAPTSTTTPTLAARPANPIEVRPDRYIVVPPPQFVGRSTINISTGPVMQQQGQTFVTLEDFEKGLQQLADVMLDDFRSAGGRRYQGVN
jgi:hypothetical protein